MARMVESILELHAHKMTCYGAKTVVIKTNFYVMLVLPDKNVGLKSSLGVVILLFP
jgi:hypothetical protein